MSSNIDRQPSDGEYSDIDVLDKSTGMKEELDPVARFISYVQANPSLYNPQDQLYKDNYLRQEKWKEIANELKQLGISNHKLDLNRLPYEWRKLKLKFVRALKLQKTGVIRGAMKKTFDHFDDMQFMVPHLNTDIEPPPALKQEVMDVMEDATERMKTNEIKLEIQRHESPIFIVDDDTTDAITNNRPTTHGNIEEDRTQSPKLHYGGVVNTQDSSNTIQSPSTLTAIKQAFENTWNQPMVFDEEVSATASSFGARLRSVKLYSEMAYVQCCKEINDVIFNYELKRFRREPPMN